MRASFLSLKIWLAINVTIMGLGALVVATVHGADKPPAQSIPRCLSPIAEPQLTYRPDGWLIDFDLLVTGTLPSMMAPTVTGSWSSDPLEVITHTYSAPNELRLVFDINSSLLSPPNSNRIHQEEDFWDHTLTDISDAENRAPAGWSALNTISSSPCNSVHPGLRWHINDLAVGADSLHSQVYNAYSCALKNAHSNVPFAFSFNDMLAGDAVVAPRTWLAIRWQPSDEACFSDYQKQPGSCDVETDIKSRYDLQNLPIGDQYVIVVLQRAFEISPVSNENRAKLQRNINDWGQGRIALYFLSVDKTQDDPSLLSEKQTIEQRLQRRNRVHLSVRATRLLTYEQAHSAYVTIDYRSRSSACDYIEVVPFPNTWSNGSTPMPPFPLDMVRWIVVAFLLFSLTFALSLWFFGRKQWFRDRLKPTPWEKHWEC